MLFNGFATEFSIVMGMGTETYKPKLPEKISGIYSASRTNASQVRELFRLGETPLVKYCDALNNGETNYHREEYGNAVKNFRAAIAVAEKHDSERRRYDGAAWAVPPIPVAMAHYNLGRTYYSMAEGGKAHEADLTPNEARELANKHHEIARKLDERFNEGYQSSEEWQRKKLERVHDIYRADLTELLKTRNDKEVRKELEGFQTFEPYHEAAGS